MGEFYCQPKFSTLLAGAFYRDNIARSWRPFVVDEDKIKARNESNQQHTVREIAETLYFDHEGVQDNLKTQNFWASGMFGHVLN